MYEIGKKIKLFREKAGLSQKEFSFRIGQQNSTVSNWERGLTRPNVDTLAIVCAVLEIAPDELLGIRHSTEEITMRERKIIMAYREKKDLQSAVDILLGIEHDES